jgi:hypothetical protein
MKTAAAITTVAALLLTGCATASSPATPTVAVAPAAPAVVVAPAAPAVAAAPAVQTFRGEVWTWDEREHTVTLYKDGQQFRVLVSPDQMRTLQLHQTATLRGQLAPPAALPTVVVPGQAMMPVARGDAEKIELTGAVATADPSGRVSITSGRGPVHLWVASGADQRFHPGSQVRAVVTIQPVAMVPGSAGGTSPSASPGSDTLATSPSGNTAEDYSVVVGRIIGVNPNGSVVIESPTGPIQVWVAAPDRYRVSDFVQVRTSLQPAS